MSDYQEEGRLDALYQLKLLNTPASKSFDRITRMASQIFGLPVAAVSLTDRDRQWLKSRIFVDHCSIPRDKAPCAAVWERVFASLTADRDNRYLMLDSTIVRAHQRAASGKGGPRTRR